MSNVDYMRVLKKVICNKCGRLAWDANVEKHYMETVSENSFNMWTEMKCGCGGEYDYVRKAITKILYKNSTDCGAGMVIDFSNIETTIDKLEQLFNDKMD